jgi:hypothetical protein
MAEMHGVDPAQRRESWINDRRAGLVRIGHGACLVAGIAVMFVTMVVVDAEAWQFAVMCYVAYAIVDGPRRILGGLAMYAEAAAALRALERQGPAPPPARLL